MCRNGQTNFKAKSLCTNFLKITVFKYASICKQIKVAFPYKRRILCTEAIFTSLQGLRNRSLWNFIG